MLREDSKIQSIFGGYVRNEVMCQICDKHLFRFDFQQTFQFAIPNNNSRVIVVCFVPILSSSASNKWMESFPKLFSIAVDKFDKFEVLISQLMNNLNNVKGKQKFLKEDFKLFSACFNTKNVSKPYISLLSFFFVDESAYISSMYL